MKRGLSSLILLVLLLSVPVVFAADSVLDLFLGSSTESLLLLRLMYGMLVWIIFLKASKESVFKENQARLGNVFSLLLAFFAMRYTPDAVIANFGWVIMVLAPIMVLYKLSGSFGFKTAEGKISWPRIILALLGSLIVLAAFGNSVGFTAGLGSAPSVGGFFDELFSDIHYYLFYKLDWFFALALATFLIFLLFQLVGRLRGGSAAGPGGFSGGFWRGLGWTLLVAALLAGLGYLLGGGIPLFFEPLVGAAATIWEYVYYILAGLALIALLYLFIRFRGWRMFPYLFRALWWLIKLPFRILWSIIGGIGRILRRIFRRRAPGAPPPPPGPRRGLGNGELILVLRTPTQTIPHTPAGRTRTTAVAVPTGSATPLIFTAYRRRFPTNVLLQNAQFTFRVNNGAMAPPNGPTDSSGQIRTVYTAPAAVGNATLQVGVTHPDLLPTTIIPNYEMNIGALGAPLTVNAPSVTVDTGNPATIIVEVSDSASGDEVNGATVEILFTRYPGVGPFTGTTAGGGPGRPATYAARTPVFPTKGTYDFTVTARATGRPNAGPIAGAVTVNDATLPELQIFNVEAQVGGAVVTRVRVGDRVDIGLSVRDNGTPPRLIDIAKVTITPATGIRPPVPRGGGRYAAQFRPTAAEIGPQNFVLKAELRGYNDAIAYLALEVETLPMINVGLRTPSAPIRSGSTGRISVDITDASGAAIDGEVEITINSTRFATGKSRAGLFEAPWTPTGVGAAKIVATVSKVIGHADNAASVTINVEPPAVLDITTEVRDASGSPLFPPVEVRTGETVDIFTSVTAAGTPVAPGMITLTPEARNPSRATMSNVRGPLSFAGWHNSNFSATVPGTYRYAVDLSGTSGGYVLPRTRSVIEIKVVAAPGLHVAVNWVPEPANKYILMNFMVIDDITGVPVSGADIAIADTHTAPVTVAGTMTTVASGQLPAALRIDLGGRIVLRGTREEHQLTVNVTHARYPPKTGTIKVTFVHPSAPGGGAQHRTF